MNWCAVSFEPTIHFQILLANLREDFFLLRQVYTRKYWEHNYSFFDANEMDCCHEVIHIFHRPFGHLTFCFWTIPVCEKELRQYFFLLWYRKKRVGNEGCSVPHRDAKEKTEVTQKNETAQKAGARFLLFVAVVGGLDLTQFDANEIVVEKSGPRSTAAHSPRVPLRVKPFNGSAKLVQHVRVSLWLPFLLLLLLLFLPFFLGKSRVAFLPASAFSSRFCPLFLLRWTEENNRAFFSFFFCVDGYPCVLLGINGLFLFLTKLNWVSHHFTRFSLFFFTELDQTWFCVACYSSSSFRYDRLERFHSFLSRWLQVASPLAVIDGPLRRPSPSWAMGNDSNLATPTPTPTCLECGQAGDAASPTPLRCCIADLTVVGVDLLKYSSPRPTASTTPEPAPQRNGWPTAEPRLRLPASPADLRHWTTNDRLGPTQNWRSPSFSWTHRVIEILTGPYRVTVWTGRSGSGISESSHCQTLSLTFSLLNINGWSGALLGFTEFWSSFLPLSLKLDWDFNQSHST